jgi:hypothetical protein
MSTLNIYHIDYFSLDIEGAELFILQSINWDRLTIDLFTIETHFDHDNGITFMTSPGYKWITKVAEDDVAMKE